MSAKIDEPEDGYTPEEILDKRERNGETQYLIKWKDYPSEDNTWEGEKNLQCPELITKYVNSLKECPNPKKGAKGGTKHLSGFARGLDAEKILGATKVDGELIYLIKWQGHDDADLVTAIEAGQKCPLVVIQFLEKNLELSPLNHRDADASEN